MAYHPLLQSGSYETKPYEAMTPAQVTALMIQKQQAEDAQRQNEQAREANAMKNRESQMGLEEQEAIHPAVMAQLAQEGRAGSAPTAAAPADPNDPYAAQQDILNQQKGLADFATAHPVLLAMSQRMAGIQKQKEDALAGQSTIAGGNYSLGLKREWEGLKPQLDAIMTPPKGGWNPLKGDKAAALARAQANIPAHLQNLPEVKDWFTNAGKEQQNTVFNMANTQTRDLTSLRTRSQANAKTYMGARSALEAAEGDYSNYLKDTSGPNTRVDQQGIIDKYTAVSLGKSPTEAQLELAQAFPGIENWFDFTAGKIKTGQIVPKGIIDEMMRNMRATTINYGRNLKQANAIDRSAAELGGIDPNRVLAFPDEQIEADSARYSKAPGMHVAQGSSKENPIDAKDRAAYDALPPGAWYKGPSGHIAQKPGRP